jgi:hypothetical protein
VVDYSARSAPVTVRLDDFSWSESGADGEAGEGDRLRFVDEVVGGQDDDVLIGDSGANVFHGGPVMTSSMARTARTGCSAGTAPTI